MSDHGATVVATLEPNLPELKIVLGVPIEASSCHSAVIDGYVIEGHVPVEAIDRLLTDRPDAVGIAVPGMPSDSPGMGGDPETWSELEVILIANDGSVVPFDF
jgi:hypothetical protein